MEFDKMKKIWQSPANAPSTAEVEEIKTRFSRSLRGRYRAFVGFSVWLIGALSFITAFVIYNKVVTHKIALGNSWAILLLLAIQWLFAIGFLWQFKRHYRTHGHHKGSIAKTLRAALDENRLARSRSTRVGWIYLIGIPLLAVAIHQLREAGKMAGNEAVSMLVLFGVTLAITGSWVAWHYYRRLLPQKREIESLLGNYDKPQPEA